MAVGYRESRLAGGFRYVPVPQSDPWLRFHTPLVEPDVRFSRIRLPDKASRFRPREARRARLELDQPQPSVQVFIWEA